MSALQVIVGLCPVVSAFLIRDLIDLLAHSDHADRGHVILLAALAGFAGILGTFTAEVASYVRFRLTSKIERAADSALVEAVVAQHGISHLEDPAYLDQLHLANQVSGPAVSGLVELLSETSRAGARMAGFVGAVAAIWPQALIGIALLLVPQYVLERWQKHQEGSLQRAMSSISRRRGIYKSLLTDVRAAREIRSFGLSAWLRQRLSQSLGDLQAAETVQMRRRAQVSLGVNSVGGLVAAAATVAAGIEVLNGRLTIGGFTLFVSAVMGIQLAASGMLTQVGVTGQSAAMYEDFLKVTERKPDLRDGAREAPVLSTSIELRDVWFRYTQDGPWVLAGVSFDIPAGTSLGLVGLNGAGKTTVIKLLCRFYDPQHGSILWNGVDIRELSVASLRRRIGVAFQDYMTYELSARENIGLGRIESIEDNDAVHRAVDVAQAGQVIASLPHGLDTMLTRNFAAGPDALLGVSLSGGQWQRVALARTLMRQDADLVILDEPSANLDAEAEYSIHERLRTWRQGKTSISISHRLNTIRDCDRIVVLSEGSVTESGNHADLMATKGDYARMFGIQASGYLDEQSDAVVLESVIGAGVPLA